MVNVDNTLFLQQRLSFKFHGIMLGNIMLHESMNVCNDSLNRMSMLKYYLVKSFKMMPLSKLTFDKNCNTILSTFGRQNRKDHKEVYDYVLQILGKRASTNDLNTIQDEYCFHPSNYIKATYGVFQSTKKIKWLSFLDRVILVLGAVYYQNCIQNLEKLNLNGIKKYLCMYNSNHIENLITQFMKLNGIPTYSLCEGLYFVEKKSVIIDSINYLHLETDHLITWGQSVIDEFVSVGVPKNRMVVGGYPHHVNISQFKRNTKLKRGLILLARYSYDSSNVALLNILSKYLDIYAISLKCHPNSDINKYSLFAEEHGMNIIGRDSTINNCLNNIDFDFAIAVNTTAYYESLMRGLPCMRYADGSFTLTPGYDDSFSNDKEFIKRIKEIEILMATDEYQNRVNKVLEYTMGIGINNYNNIL